MLPVGFSRVDSALATVSTAAVESYCGIGAVAGNAVIDVAGTPTLFPNGNPVVAATQGLATVPYASRVAPTKIQKGMLTDANNRLVTVTVALAVAPIQQQNGYLFDANGAVVITGGSTVIFEDNFTGTGGTLMSAHAPDIAPPGFAWITNLGSMGLDGAGQAQATSVGDAQSYSNFGAIAVNTPFIMEVTLTPLTFGLTESGFLSAGPVGGPYARVRIGNTDLTNWFAEFLSPAGVLLTVAVSNAEHTLKMTFNVDGTVTCQVDGVTQGTPAGTPPATIAQIILYLSAEPGITYKSNLCRITNT